MATARFSMVIIVGIALLHASSLAEEGQTTLDRAALARAERILADEDLFAPVFAKRVQTLMQNVVSGVFKDFGLVVPDEKRPEIALVRKRHGDPEKIAELPRGPSGPGLPEPPIDTLYSYGPLQLGVPKGSSTGTVEWIKIVSQ